MIFLDFETRSVCNIKKSGAFRYSRDSSTQVLCLCYAFSESPDQVNVIAPWQFPGNGNTGCDYVFPVDKILKKRVENGELLCAHNAFFERCIWENHLSSLFDWPIPKPEQWVCSMATGLYNGLPGKLDEIGKFFHFEKSDNRTMLRMAKPDKKNNWYGTSESYKKLIEYCKQDVRVERFIYKQLYKLSYTERQIWLLDQKINWRGMPIDSKLAYSGKNAVAYFEKNAKKRIKEITNGELDSVSKIQQIRNYLLRHGVDLPNLQKKTVEEVINDVDDPVCREILEIRQSVGKSGIKKFQSTIDRSHAGRIHGGLQYYTAHTGRWGGRGFQIQNAVKVKIEPDLLEGFISGLKRGKIRSIDGFTPSKLLSACVRGIVCAESGYSLVVWDYASIEARVLAWLAEDKKLLDAFRDGIDLYIDMAADIYRINPNQVTKDQRALGKVAILGLGYGMGAKTFLETCINWGIKDINRKLAERVVTLYRKKYPKIVYYWYELEKAIKKVWRTKQFQKYGKMIISRDGTKLLITLPSNRILFYQDFGITDNQIYYFGRLKNNKWGKVESWGGKFTENIDQAISRDLLAQSLLTIDRENMEIVATVHDEVICHVQENGAKETAEKIRRILNTSPLWARDLPIGVEGWIGKRYRKS